MKSICVMGMTDTGKSKEVKDFLRGLNAEKFIFDVQAEYGEFQRVNPTLDFDKFIQMATQKKKTVIVFEEATIFFSTKGRVDQIVQILVGKKHKQNIIIFCFHSITDVPRYIRRLIDYFWLKRTNDTAEEVWTTHKNKKLLAHFEHVKEKSKLDPYYTHRFKQSDL